jgi:translocation and assembly module TamA
MLLCGCSHLPFGAKKEDASAPASPPAYDLHVEAPDALRVLLLAHLDLTRLRTAPDTEGIAGAELDRLVAAAPAQVRALLETEGYYAPEVRVARDTPAEGLPQVRIQVVPGPRTMVDAVQIDVTGELHDAAQAGDADAARTLAAMRRRWALQAGQPLRAAAWNDAKKAALQALRSQGYAAAAWTRTEARIDADEHRAQLQLAADSGPRYRLGPVSVTGLQRYGEDDVRRLAGFVPGQPYTEQVLRDYQERLQKANLFESAVVEIDPNPATHDAAPVRVRVKEQQVQQATVGIGYSANTGPRVTLEHTHRKLLRDRWMAKNKVELGPDLQSWTGDLTSHPLPNLYRNVLSGSYERLRSADEWRTTWTARVGRTKDTVRIERVYYAELTQSRVDTPAGSEESHAASLNYHWTWRGVDSVLAPTDGTTLALQGAGGYAVGHHLTEDGITEGRGPFTRALARLTWYRPFPRDDTVAQRWYLKARIEAGQVFANDDVSVPDPLLFRAGGDDSVRGYDYRTLGPVVDGVVTSGRMLATGSLEIERPISPRRPQLLWAAFVDAGNAANRWHELHAALGYGVGVHWRSPIGSLRVDLAYGQEVHKARVHVSIGIAL